MSLESGGRGDKYGNTYEDRHRASLLEQIAREQLRSIKVEALDNGRDIAEYTVTDNDGKHRYYQCKSSNGNKDSWSVADLNHYNVFSRVKELMSEDPDANYYFVSPLRYKQLDELCKRARTNCGYEEFKNYQLSNKDIIALFDKCVESFKFEKSEEGERHAQDLLARCHFETWNCGPEYQAVFERNLDAFFMGNPTALRNSLENFIQDTGWYGRELTANAVVGHLQTQGFQLRSRIASNTVLPKIYELNRYLWKEYYPIKNKLIHRNATDEVLQSLESGNSVILHGAAGCGKSGCLEELRNELECRNILYLSLKLDQYPPLGTADSYGQSLGFLQSPVPCLAQISRSKPCVLILDQLDALRWSGKNSGMAIRICKQIISQAARLNEFDKTKISIVFSSRTVDLENDQGLRHLFETSDENRQKSSLKWDKVQISPLSEQETAQVIGPNFEKLPERMKKILAVPSSLYVWFELPEQKRKNVIYSSFELMEAWWDALLEKGEENSFSRQQLCECKDNLVHRLETTSTFMLPISLFDGFRNCIDFFISGSLLQKGANNTVSFVHQSFWDYFVAQSLQDDIYEGKMLCDLLKGSEEQTPIWRYRLLTVLQNLIVSDEKLFLKQASALLESPDVRFYMKCTVFEVIGQSEQVSDKLYHFVKTYKDIPEWKQYINDVVFYGHPPFLQALERIQKPDWNEETYFSLLYSVVNEDSDFVIDKVSRWQPQNIQDAYKISHLICYGIFPKHVSTGVSICLEILEKFPELWNRLMLIYILVESNSKEAIEVLEARLKNSAIEDEGSFTFGENDCLDSFAQNFYQDIPVRLFPYIVQKTVPFPQSYNQLNHTLDFWKYTRKPQFHSKNILREVIELVKKAIIYWGEIDSTGLYAFVKEHSLERQTVFSHEVLMHAILALPEKYSDNAIEWLLEDFKNRAFVFTDEPTDYLENTKALIQKFSSTCSKENFEILEKTMCVWNDSHDRMISNYRVRLEARKNSKQEPCFYPYWGYLQKELLPCLDYNRMSPYTMSLLHVLERNTYIFEKPYHCGILGGQSGACISPIEGKKLGDSDWLQIVCVPKEEMNQWKSHFINGCWVEATPYTFGAALRGATRKEPERFAKLLLRFSKEDCLPVYYCAVIDSLGDIPSDSAPENTLIFKVVRCVSQYDDSSICMSMLRMIEHYSELSWPEDIVKIVEELALYHSDPDPNKQNKFGEDESLFSAVINQSLNHVRSYALRVLARLLLNHVSGFERIKHVVQQAMLDSAPCVLYSLSGMIAACYNTDPKFAVASLKKLAKKNLAAICAKSPISCWYVINKNFLCKPSYYRKLIGKLCKSEISDVACVGAGWLCALCVCRQDKKLLSFLRTYSFSKKQKESIVNQAVYSFQNSEHRLLSKKIILLFSADLPELDTTEISLVRDNLLSVTEDYDLLSCMLKASHNKFATRDILDYLYNSDCELCLYLSDFQHIASTLDYSQNSFGVDQIAMPLVRCVSRVFEESDEHTIKSDCLDIWDTLYRNSSGRAIFAELFD